MSVVLLRGDARELPLPDASVDLVVTSPPYFLLRSYTDNGQPYDGQVGAEETPKEYVSALLDCTREWMRVLKPEGSIFVVLGDKYSTYTGANWGNGRSRDGFRGVRKVPHGGPVNAPEVYGIPYKSLMGLPWRYALGCIDDLGLILRSENIWSKANGMPESATDRTRRSHEQVFHFTQLPRYYSAVDEVREPHSDHTLRYYGPGTNAKPRPSSARRPCDGGRVGRQEFTTASPLGKLPGSVWEIPGQPLKVPAELGVDHFAAFPMELPQRCILGWSPAGVCTACGEGRRPVVGKPGLPGGDNNPDSRNGTRRRSTMDGGSAEWARRIANPDRITGYACACTEPTAPAGPAVVLDPFGGTGTTALVADVLGRTGISVDRSADYCRLARWRTTDPGERAKALQVPKPPPVPDGQESLFEVGA